jgi:hypothetical protein
MDEPYAIFYPSIDRHSGHQQRTGFILQEITTHCPEGDERPNFVT